MKISLLPKSVGLIIPEFSFYFPYPIFILKIGIMCGKLSILKYRNMEKTDHHCHEYLNKITKSL